MKNKKNKKSSVTDKLITLFIIVFFPVIIVLVIFMLIWIFLYRTFLSLVVRLCWYPKGKYMLFVYSDSPNWKDYIESNILPRISSHAVIINWSERDKWNWKRKPLELRIFKEWSGARKYYFKGKKAWDGKEFNPLVVTFIPWWKRKVFRFWEPFKDFKHGKEKPLKDIESELFEILEIIK